VSLAVLLTLYLVFDLVEAHRLLGAAGGGLTLTLRYLADRSAAALWHMLPGAALLGLSVALGVLARRGELTALFAAGFRPLRLLAPLCAVAGAASALAWAVGEHWMPSANRRIDALVRRATENDRPGPARERHHWLRAGERFFHLRALGPGLDEVQGVTVYEMGGGFRPRRRLDADRMRWRDGGWVLLGVTLRDLEREATLERQPELRIPLDAPPDRLRAGAASPSTLAASELGALIEWKRREGQDAAFLEGALAERRSWALLPLLLSLVVAPLGFAPRRATHLLAAIGRALAIAATLGAVAFGAQTLARAGHLAPWLAAWLPAVLTGLAGAVLTGRLLANR
jgi:lipopolysaccharide export system permease protein